MCVCVCFMFYFLLYFTLINGAYSLYNFEIRRDITSSRLRTSLRVTIKRACFAAIPYTTRAFHNTSPEIRNLPEVTSGLISKLYRLNIFYKAFPIQNNFIFQ